MSLRVHVGALLFGAVYVAATVTGCGSTSDDALFTDNGKAGTQGGSTGGSSGNGGTFGSAGTSGGGSGAGGSSTGASGGASSGGSGTGGSATGGSGGSSGDDAGTTGGTGGSGTDAGTGGNSGTGGNPGTGGSGAAGSGGTGGSGNGPFVRCEQSECNRGAGERCCVRPSQQDTCYDANNGSCVCTLCGPADCDGPSDCPDGQRCCASLAGILCQSDCGSGGSEIEICQNGDGIDCSNGGNCMTNGYLPQGYLGCTP